MYPHSHFLFGLFLGIVLLQAGILSSTGVILLSVLAVLIDVDHFLYFAFKHKSASVRNAWNAAVVFHEKGERTFIHNSLGGVLVLVLCVLLFFISSQLSIIVLVAYLSHMLLDYMPFPSSTSKKFSASIFKFSLAVSYRELVFDVLLTLCIGIMLI
ncbi:MAG: metal-dependent hydrolase [Candidatus Woesearchaeota archaeon]|nr:MAG: metal-dependent hydrolase [Candidatus Woesearchaeota archaeon]